MHGRQPDGLLAIVPVALGLRRVHPVPAQAVRRSHRNYGRGNEGAESHAAEMVPKYGRRTQGRTAPTPTRPCTFTLRLTLRFTLRLTFALRFRLPPPVRTWAAPPPPART